MSQKKPTETYTAVIEYCETTKQYVGYVPGFAGAHSRGDSVDQLRANLCEVVEMLLEDGEPELQSRFVGIQQLAAAVN